MRLRELFENTGEWITHRDLANIIYTRTGNKQLALDFDAIEDEFVSQDDAQSTGLSGFDVDALEFDRERVNKILGDNSTGVKVLKMKQDEEYNTLYQILQSARLDADLTEQNKFTGARKDAIAQGKNSYPDKDLIKDFIDDGYSDEEILDLAQGEYDPKGIELLRGYLPKLRAGLRPGLSTDLINSPIYSKLRQHRIRGGKSTTKQPVRIEPGKSKEHQPWHKTGMGPDSRYQSPTIRPGVAQDKAASLPAGVKVPEPHDPDSSPDNLDLYKSSNYIGKIHRSDYYTDPEDNYSDVTLDYMDDIEQLYQNGRNPDQIVRDLMSRYGLPTVTARKIVNNYNDMRSGDRTSDMTGQRKQMSNYRTMNTNKGRGTNRNKMVPKDDQENK